MKWKDFANKCGYRGEGWLKTTVETVNNLPEINQKNLEDFIEDIEEDFEKNNRNRN